VSTIDRILTCRECGGTFKFSAGEQAFYANRGLLNPPSRCSPCRNTRKTDCPPAPPARCTQPPAPAAGSSRRCRSFRETTGRYFAASATRRRPAASRGRDPSAISLPRHLSFDTLPVPSLNWTNNRIPYQKAMTETSTAEIRRPASPGQCKRGMAGPSENPSRAADRNPPQAESRLGRKPPLTEARV